MNKREILLDQLMEEAAEVIQSASKVLRFGVDDHYEGRATTNSQDLRVEIAQFWAFIEELEAAGVKVRLPVDEFRQVLADKKEKMKKMMEYSRARGVLTD